MLKPVNYFPRCRLSPLVLSRVPCFVITYFLHLSFTWFLRTRLTSLWLSCIVLSLIFIYLFQLTYIVSCSYLVFVLLCASCHRRPGIVSLVTVLHLRARVLEVAWLDRWGRVPCYRLLERYRWRCRGVTRVYFVCSISVATTVHTQPSLCFALRSINMSFWP